MLAVWDQNLKFVQYFVVYFTQIFHVCLEYRCKLSVNWGSHSPERNDSVNFGTSVLCNIGLVERVVILICIMNNLMTSKHIDSDYRHNSVPPNQKSFKQFCYCQECVTMRAETVRTERDAEIGRTVVCPARLYSLGEQWEHQTNFSIQYMLKTQTVGEQLKTACHRRQGGKISQRNEIFLKETSTNQNKASHTMQPSIN